MPFLTATNRSQLNISHKAVPTKESETNDAHLGTDFSPFPHKDEHEESMSLSFLHRPARSGDDSQVCEQTLRENTRKNSYCQPEEEDLPLIDSCLSPSESSLSERPNLVRKKSGELVKSSLKLNRLSRTASLPATPSDKQVHFGGDKDLVNVRYFNERERPTAISASNSPKYLQKSDSHDDYFTYKGIDWQVGSDEDNLTSDDDDNFACDWRLELCNFGAASYKEAIKTSKMVFLERCFISSDKNYLVGQISAKNIAFEKLVVARYTLNNWRTVIEAEAHYVGDIPRILRRANYDRFVFKLPLDTLFRRTTADEQKVSICVKYCTSGLEFWDNNNHENFDFCLIKTKNHTKKNMSGSTQLKQSKRFSPSVKGANYAPFTDPLSLGSPMTPRLLSDQHTPFFTDLMSVNNKLSKLDTSEDVLEPRSLAGLKSKTRLTDNFKSAIIGTKNGSSEPVVKEETTSTGSPTKSKSEILTSSRPPINSKSYQDLVNNYCFFKSPHSKHSPVASVLQHLQGSEAEQQGSSV